MSLSIPRYPLSLAVAALMAGRVASAQSGGLLVTCLAAAADYSPVHPTSVFTATSPELDAIFRLGPSEHYARLEAKWIAVDVGQTAPPNTLAGSNTVTLNRNTVAGVLRLMLGKGFPSGRYRLDVSADGKPWKSVGFQVVPAAADAGLATLGALMPLERGKTWSYSFVQEAGGIGKISKAPPGATLGPDGKVRASVTATVAGTEADGVHITWARGGVPFSEEQWRLTPAGLAVVKRTVGGESLVLEPPQVIFPWPAKMGRSWTYASRDKTLHQRYRIWGPLPLKRPNGEVSGYVVLVEQKGPGASTTVEREYVPGLGMVRSITVVSLGTDLVSREELVLVGGP